jgi:hypothetical protein
VLQWGNNGDFGGSYWTIASWYVSGSYGLHSPPLTVHPGDLLQGQIAIADNVQPGVYEIITSDETLGGKYTYLYTNTVNPMNTVQGGVEVYYVKTCSQYPSSWPVTFSNIETWQAGDRALTTSILSFQHGRQALRWVSLRNVHTRYGLVAVAR